MGYLPYQLVIAGFRKHQQYGIFESPKKTHVRHSQPPNQTSQNSVQKTPDFKAVKEQLLRLVKVGIVTQTFITVSCVSDEVVNDPPFPGVGPRIQGKPRFPWPGLNGWVCLGL